MSEGHYQDFAEGHICPGLPYRMSINILISILIFIFVPLMLTIGALVGSFVACYGGIYGSFLTGEIRHIDNKIGRGSLYCCFFFTLLPLSLILASLVIGIGVPIGSLIAYVLIPIFLIKLLINYLGCCVKKRNVAW
jgi:hypothetical protein